MSTYSKSEICKLFGCSMDQLNRQYKANAETLGKMEEKASRTGKKVNGYSAENLKQMKEKYIQFSKP